MNTIDSVLTEFAVLPGAPELALGADESATLTSADGRAILLDRDEARELLHIRSQACVLSRDELNPVARDLLAGNADVAPGQDYCAAWDTDAGALVASVSIPYTDLTAATLMALLDEATVAADRLTARVNALRAT